MRQQMMIRKRVLQVLFGVLGTALLAVGCGATEVRQESASEGEEIQSTASNKGGKRVFEAKIDGELFDFSKGARADYVAPMNTLSLASGSCEIMIMRIDLDTLELPTIIGREQYETTEASQMGQVSVIAMAYTDETGNEWSGGNVGLTIESIDGQRIRGSFSGTLSLDGGEDDQIDLSEGRFDLELVR